MRRVSFWAVLLAVVPFVGAFARQTAPQPTAGWRNLQVLKQLNAAPAHDLYDVMDFIAGSLSVSCDYCHRLDSFETDAKPAKARAREMLRMTRAINDANFGGQTVVTCQTCHHGQPRPASVPVPWYRTPDEIEAYKKTIDGTATPPAASQTAVASLPSADVILANYRRAVGAADVRSMKFIGTFTSEQASGSIEYLALLPDQIQITRVIHGVTSRQILNRDHGWLVTTAARQPIQSPDLALLYQDTRLKVFLPPGLTPTSAITVSAPELVNGRPCYVLSQPFGAGSERWYFDADSWLLAKMRREIPTILGTSVREIEWRDYRETGGVRRPFKTLDHYMGNEVDTTYTAIYINVPVDPAIFEPPAPAEPKSVTLPPAALDAVAGRYELGPGNIMTITREGAQLFLTQSNGAKIEVLATSPTDFFLRGVGAALSFTKNSAGEVTGVTIKQGSLTRECPKVK